MFTTETETFITVAVYVLTGLLGLCVGSFLNVVIYRVPLDMSIVFPASHCPKCQAPIKAYDNIPVLSYLLLGGKCRNCKEPISFRYTAVELSNALLWLACVWCFWKTSIPYALIAAATASVLLCVFFIDLEHMVIPDRFQIILAVLAVGATVFDHSPFSGGAKWWSHLIGAAAGFLVTFLVGLIGSKIAGREALGGGDIKLCTVMGLYLGWQRFIFAMLVSSIVASVVLLLLKRIRKEEREYPFAPFLASGFMLAILCGDAILGWYLSLLI